jgi:hypothetical protein
MKRRKPTHRVSLSVPALVYTSVTLPKQAQGEERPLSKEPSPPQWHFIDGNVTWHLLKNDKETRVVRA